MQRYNIYNKGTIYKQKEKHDINNYRSRQIVGEIEIYITIYS